MSAPATLPADFFKGPKNGEAPDTLPADFFDQQEAAPTGDVSDPTKGFTPPSTGLTAGREGLLGLFSGLGIPETMSPLTDMVKNAGTAPRSFSDIPFAGPITGIAKGLYGAGKDLLTGNETGTAAHGLGSLVGQGLQLGTAAKIPEAGENAVEAGSNLRGKLGDFLHDPTTGDPKSVPKAINDLAVNKIAPESARQVAERQMEADAQARMQRGKEQEALDRKAAVEARRSPENTKLFRGSAAKVADAEYQRNKSVTEAQQAAQRDSEARDRLAASRNPENSKTFQSSASRVADADYQRQKAITEAQESAQRDKAKEPIALSGTMTNDPNLGPMPRLGTGLVSPTATTTTGGQFVGKITPPESGRIVEPGSTPPPQKITGQSWSRDNLISAIKDPQTPYQTRVLMAKELLRNLGDKEFPANFRYLLEGNAPMQPWRNLKR